MISVPLVIIAAGFSAALHRDDFINGSGIDPVARKLAYILLWVILVIFMDQVMLRTLLIVGNKKVRIFSHNFQQFCFGFEKTLWKSKLFTSFVHAAVD